MALRICLALALSFSCSLATLHWQTLGGSTHYLKRLTPGLFVAGRLTSRQLGYVTEAGFNTVISLADFPTRDDVYNGMAGEWPSTTEEGNIVTSYGKTAVALSVDLTLESYEAVESAILKAAKPVLIHCENGYTASLFAELYLVNSGTSAAEDIYNNSLTLGWDFQSDQSAIDFIHTVIGVSAELAAPQLELTLANGEQSYKDYYWPHRLDSDLYFSLGQVLETQVGAIKAAGYKTVISFRANGESTNRLSWEATSGPVANGEFSDANGNYNVTMEEAAFSAVGIQFYNLPVSGSEAYTAAQFESFVPTFDKAAANGPVLVHCASGYRSAVYTLSYMALQDPSTRCIDWAIKQARRVGESLDLLSSDQKAINFWRSTLAC